MLPRKVLALLAPEKNSPSFWRFDCRDRARPVFEPRDCHELPRPTLIGLALADRYDEEARSAKVEVPDVECGDFGPPAPGSEGKQQDRTVAHRERRRRQFLDVSAAASRLVVMVERP